MAWVVEPGWGAHLVCAGPWAAISQFAGSEGGGFGPAVEVDVPLAAVSIVAGYRALLKVVSDLPGHRHADKLRWFEDPGRWEGAGVVGVEHVRRGRLRAGADAGTP